MVSTLQSLNPDINNLYSFTSYKEDMIYTILFIIFFQPILYFKILKYYKWKKSGLIFVTGLKKVKR